MNKIEKYYKEILGIDLSDLVHPIAMKINSLAASTQTDKMIKEHHLRILGISLMDIKTFDQKIYDYYLKRIIKNNDISINGHIFEINQCALFLRISKAHNLDFKFGDANIDEPDFIVNNFGFEITSSRFAENSNKSNPGRKLLNKFREKNNKPYANTECTLLIDINQISYHTNKDGRPVSPTFEEVREIVRKESKFGLVIFLMEWIDKTKTINFKGTAYTVYNENCNSDLKLMMEEKFMPKKNTFEGQILISSN